MGNGIVNKIKSLFDRKKDENKNEEIKVEKPKHDSTTIHEKEIKPKFQENQTSRVSHSNENKTNNLQKTNNSHENRIKQPRDSKDYSENRNKQTRKNNKGYNDSTDKNKKTFNDKKFNERKSYDNKSRNNKFDSNNGKVEIDKKIFTSKIEKLIKGITVGMEFVSDNFKGEIIKKQSYNLSYTTANGEIHTLTYKEIIVGYAQMSKTGSLDEKWYEANFNNNDGSSNLRMICAILKNK